MGTKFVSTNNLKVDSSRSITVTTAAAQLVVLSSGYSAMFVSNIGAGAVAWGDSTIAMGSGALLFYSMGRQFDGDAFFRADSVATVLLVNDLISG